MSESWTFLTNHSHVLLCIAANPDILTRDIADLVGITERSAQRIISELEEAGYLSHHKIGRRNHYEIHANLPLRHPLESHLEVEALLEVLTPAVEIAGVKPRD
jgi:DNA-binding Lrp family transcriptional regulator